MKHSPFIAPVPAVVSVWTVAALALVPAQSAADSSDRSVALSGGPFEPSGVARAPGGSGVLFVDDGRPDAVYWLTLAADGSLAAPPVAIPLGLQVVDPEGITTDGTYVYVVGSQSRGSRDGAGLVRFRFDGKTRRARNAEAITDLALVLSAQVSALREARGDDKSPLNIEGLAWDAKGGRLLLGLLELLSTAAGRW